MPKFRCDFEVDSDMVLPPGQERLDIVGGDGFMLTLRNGNLDAGGYVKNIIITVIGEAPSIESARDKLSRRLAEKLDLLSFATQSRFKIKTPLRLIEWEPFEKCRNFQAFHSVDTLYPPDPELAGELLQTAISLDNLNLPPFTRTALHYFRIGMLDRRPEDQFMHMWLSLEIIAENIKSNSKENIICENCNEQAICANCGHEPQRTPMATHEIRNIIRAISGSKSPELSKRLLKTRHALMHGRDPNEALANLGATLSQVTDELGHIVWNAIFSTIPTPDELELVFCHRGGQFFTPQLVVSMTGIFEYPGVTDHPTDEQIPSPSISIEATPLTQIPISGFQR